MAETDVLSMSEFLMRLCERAESADGRFEFSVGCTTDASTEEMQEVAKSMDQMAQVDQRVDIWFGVDNEVVWLASKVSSTDIHR